MVFCCRAVGRAVIISTVASAPPSAYEVTPGVGPEPVEVTVICEIMPAPSTGMSMVVSGNVPTAEPVVDTSSVIAVGNYALALVVEGGGATGPEDTPMVDFSKRTAGSLVVGFS